MPTLSFVVSILPACVTCGMSDAVATPLITSILCRFSFLAPLHIFGSWFLFFTLSVFSSWLSFSLFTVLAYWAFICFKNLRTHKSYMSSLSVRRCLVNLSRYSPWNCCVRHTVKGIAAHRNLFCSWPRVTVVNLNSVYRLWQHCGRVYFKCQGLVNLHLAVLYQFFLWSRSFTSRTLIWPRWHSLFVSNSLSDDLHLRVADVFLKFVCVSWSFTSEGHYSGSFTGHLTC